MIRKCARLLLLLMAAFAGCSPSSQERPPRAVGFLQTSFSVTVGRPEAAPFVAHWRSDRGDLAVVPRQPRKGAPAGLFGVIPSGPTEGVLSLAEWDEPARAWRGTYLSSPQRERRRVHAVQPSSDALEVTIDGLPALRFRRVGAANVALLESIAIVGHRGLSLGRPELMNSLTGIEDCWWFGCSGVELDVTVPHTAAGLPRVDMLRVHHPAEWRSEITGFDSTSDAVVAAEPDLRTALRKTAEAGLTFVYLDPKLRWLVSDRRDAARRALQTMVDEATAHVATHPETMVAIGSETSGPGEAADIITDMRQRQRWERGLLWALEITRGTNVETAVTRVRQTGPGRPDVISLNLLRLNQGGGGWLRLFIRSLPTEAERAFTTADQPVIYWTARDAGQFTAIVRSLSTAGRTSPARAAIVTPYPHRLAFHLATTRVH